MLKKIFLLKILLLSTLLLTACESDFAKKQMALFQPGHKFLIYGGIKHDVYLGCESCSKTDLDSVFNKNGKYGSETSLLSIYNKKGPYGSISSSLSACNVNASNPPLLMDNNNLSYGYLTINPKNEHPAFPQALLWVQDVCNSNQ